MFNSPSIWTDFIRMGGKPCIRDTRFTIAQLLAELAEGRSTQEVAEAFNLDFEKVQGALDEVALYFDVSWSGRVPQYPSDVLRKAVENPQES
jgi:uncharacterized protein (DUF433 family)